MLKIVRVAYFGTPEFSATILEKLLKEASIDVRLVVTQPDKPVGRKQILTPSPVKQVAQAHTIPVYDGSAKHIGADIMDVDLAILFAYGEIIPQKLLDMPKYGFWNIHPSLLPAYRGATPVVFPLLLGDNQTGVTLMQMNADLDHGPIISQNIAEIQLSDRQPDLRHKLVTIAYELLHESLETLISTDTISTTDQDHSCASYTRQLTKEDGFIPFEALHAAITGKHMEYTQEIIQDFYKRNPHIQAKNNSLPAQIFNVYRALYPWPGIWTKVTIQGVEKRVKITDVAYTDNNLTLNKVQLEGKNEVDFKTFNAAYKLF